MSWFEDWKDNSLPVGGEKVIVLHPTLHEWVEVEYIEPLIRPIGAHRVKDANGEIFVTHRLDCILGTYIGEG